MNGPETTRLEAIVTTFDSIPERGIGGRDTYKGELTEELEPPRAI
jgi:hypothetical protein